MLVRPLRFLPASRIEDVDGLCSGAFVEVISAACVGPFPFLKRLSIVAAHFLFKNSDLSTCAFFVG